MATWSNASSTESFPQLYERYLGYGDPRVENMLFMKSPVPVTLICIGYLYFVLSLGPKLMAKRQPFVLKNIIAVYNLFQVVFNGLLFAYSLHMWVKYYGWGLGCLPLTYEDETIEEQIWGARLCHLYFVNKIIDLLDTVFFVLKKKQDKISVLHVFHHTVMPFSVWFGVKFHPGGNLAFFGLPNLFVHIWMYLYYLVAILGPQYQKYIWWKRHLTEMQLVQFAMVGLYIGYVSHVCNLHPYFTYWIFALNFAFILLFSDFYYKAYKRKANIKEKSKIEKTN